MKIVELLFVLFEFMVVIHSSCKWYCVGFKQIWDWIIKEMFTTDVTFSPSKQTNLHLIYTQHYIKVLLVLTHIRAAKCDINLKFQPRTLRVKCVITFAPGYQNEFLSNSINDYVEQRMDKSYYNMWCHEEVKIRFSIYWNGNLNKLWLYNHQLNAQSYLGKFIFLKRSVKSIWSDWWPCL